MKSAVTVWRKQQKEKELLGLTGTIVTWTRIMVAPPQYAKSTPYVVLLVELADGGKMYGQFVDFEESELRIGQKVQSTLRRMGEVSTEDVLEYGIKFKPL